MKDGEEIGFIKINGVHQRYIETRSSVRLRLLTIKSRSAAPRGRILFVPGWMSFSDTWRLVIRELSSSFDVYYMESREKNSSLVDRESSFGIDELAHDYKVVTDDICRDGHNFFVVCSSIGAATVIRGFSQGVRPTAIAMISPILRPEIPLITPYLSFLFRGPFARIGRTLVSWWYGLFVYRVSKDQFQHSRFLQVLENCEPWKMTHGARDLTGLRIKLKEVSKLDIPVFIVGASEDPQHLPADIEAMTNSLKLCRKADLLTFSNTHSPTSGRLIREFLNSAAASG